ncbi:MAG TPA: class I SAM-dependent methyltransferase [Trebonia sp.]|nr:class I SAM-dependent methyltransferase [Trebonia sp.]
MVTRAKRARVSHPFFARIFPPLIRAMDAGGMAERRTALLRDLTGTVMDVGCGTGANFTRYPASVTRVVAVEPEPRLRHLATDAARVAPVPVDVTDGIAGALPAADGSLGAVVVTFVLCSVPDQDEALAEIRRVLRPGGTLCFLEHVRGHSAGIARTQAVLDATVWPRLAGGCHLGRDTVAAIERAGFAIGDLDRFMLPAARSPMSFHVAGHATSP